MAHGDLHVVIHRSRLHVTDRIAFVFPGQGSQRAGMASAWLPAAAGLFEQLGDAAGLDLVALADDADACAASTRIGQPAITATSLAALAALHDAGVHPDVVAGHSLGEVTAAIAAGVFSPQEGIALVAARGRAMGRACRSAPGTMAAVLRGDPTTVEEVVGRTDGVVVANVNAPGQVVLSGTEEAVAAAADELREAGARVLPLEVEGAFHSPAMAGAVAALSTAMRWTPERDPQVPLVTAVDGATCLDGGAVRRSLVDGVLAPVRWTDVQHALVEARVGLLVEVGPGGALAGMARRTVPDVQVVGVAGPDDVAAAVDAMAALRAAPAARQPATASA